MDNASFQTTLETPVTTSAVVATAIQKLDAVPKPGVQSTEAPKIEAEKPKEDNVTHRFGVLAKREQQLVRERQAIVAERQRIEAEQKSISELRSKIAEEDALWQSNPREAAKKRGLTYDQWTQIELNDGRPTPDMVARATVKEELSAFEKRQQEERQKELEKAQTAEKERYQQTLNEFREETQNFIKAPEQQEAYELINLHDASEVVLATIEEHFQSTKTAGRAEVMSIKQACDLVEKYLEDQVEKSTKTKKWSARVNPQPQSKDEKAVEAKPSPQTVPPRTISNNLTSSAQGARPLTRDERIKRALTLKVS